MNAFEKLERYRKLRQRMVFLPILGMEILTTPLTVGDDLSLRTMIVSPELYDHEITKLIYNHIEFPKLERKPSYNEFIERLSAFDRQYALWGIFTSTYETFGTQDIKCPKCDETWKHEIKIDELIQPDFAKKIWRSEEPFITYTFPIDIMIELEGISKFRFITCIPTIKRRLDVMKLITPDNIQKNMDRYGSIFSRSEDITLITKAIEIHMQDSSTPDIIDKISDINKSLIQYIPEQIAKDIIEQYNSEHDKYIPEFKMPFGCNGCGNEFDYHVNIEMTLFQQFFRIK
jgi:hypothetical protein